MLGRETLDLPVPEGHPFRRQILRGDIGGVHHHAVLPEDPENHAFYVARYDAGIRGADNMARLVLDALEASGREENTIVALVADHGEALGEHGYYFEHGRFPYDDSTLVPLAIQAPGLEPRRVERPVAAFSLAPTLMELAGLPVPLMLEAPSLVPLFRGGKMEPHVFGQSGYQLDFTLSVRDERWKLIHVPNPVDRMLQTGSEYELYDLQSDPGETINLYAEEPETAARLRQALEQWSRPWRERAYHQIGPLQGQVDDETRELLRSLGYVD